MDNSSKKKKNCTMDKNLLFDVVAYPRWLLFIVWVLRFSLDHSYFNCFWKVSFNTNVLRNDWWIKIWVMLTYATIIYKFNVWKVVFFFKI